MLKHWDCRIVVILLAVHSSIYCAAFQSTASEKGKQGNEEHHKQMVSINKSLVALQIAGPKTALKVAVREGLDPVKVNRKLLGQRRIKEAFAWVAGMVEVHSGFDKAKMYFEKAWLHYHQGEFAQAKHDANLILSSYASERTKANCQYLLGLVTFREGFFNESRVSFDRALKIYSKEDNVVGQYLCFVEMAAMAIFSSKLEEGEQFLKKADELRTKTSYDAGRIFELKAHLHFIRAEYDAFHADALSAVTVYLSKNKLDSALWMNIHIALAYAIQGDFGSAYNIAIENDRDILKMDDLRAWHYNNLTWILMDRCQGYGYSEMRSEMLTWIRDNTRGSNLSNLLFLVENVSCRN